MQNILNLANRCKITLEGPEGVREYEKTNITCVAGRTSLAKRIGGDSDTDLGVAKYIAVGTGTTPATEYDILLDNETHRSIVMTSLTIF